MTTFYADSSALVRAYLGDEPGSASLRKLLLESGESVVTSELSLVASNHGRDQEESAGAPTEVSCATN